MRHAETGHVKKKTKTDTNDTFIQTLRHVKQFENNGKICKYISCCEKRAKEKHEKNRDLAILRSLHDILYKQIQFTG